MVKYKRLRVYMYVSLCKTQLPAHIYIKYTVPITLISAGQECLRWKKN